MSSILHRFMEVMSGVSELSRSSQLLISFSGGCDSVALTRLLLESGYKQLHLCYFDHGYRSDASRQRDIAFVTSFATSLSLPYSIKKCPVKFVSTTYGCSVEEAGHVLRRALLKHMASLKKVDAVLTAHHQNDLEETMVFRLVKGMHSTGTPLKFRMPFHDQCFLLRPLLTFQKSQLQSFLDSIDQSFVEDETNHSLDYERNRIRQRLIPEFKTLNAQFSQGMYRFFDTHDQLLHDHLTDIKGQEISIQWSMDGFRMELDQMGSMTSIQRHYVMMTVLQQLYTKAYPKKGLKAHFIHRNGVSSKHVKQLVDLILSNKRGHLMDLPNHKSVTRVGDAIVFSGFYAVATESEVRVFGKVLKNVPHSLESSQTRAYISVAKGTSIELSASFVSKQDQFIPFGRSGYCRVWDYLAKQGVSAYDRAHVRVVKLQDEIVWIPGFTIDDRVKVGDDSTRQLYQLDLEHEHCDKQWIIAC